MNKTEFRKIPKVDILQQESEIKEITVKVGTKLVTELIRSELEEVRKQVKAGKPAAEKKEIVKMIYQKAEQFYQPSLKKVINATGIVLHTNLARAPLGNKILSKMLPTLSGYSNLEFDLKKAERGQRNKHVEDVIKFITGAQAALVVNNNAAAVMLCLQQFAQGKEAIISRGELVEIGGSFRIPDIMRSSGAKMVEVGTTNRTRLEDYENAITENTKVIFKAHKSNYYIQGFTEEAEISQLAALAKQNGLIFIYDIGSGLLRKPQNLPLQNEPDVKTAIKMGANLVTFSGDKLLGGPQAGIIVGNNNLVGKLAKAPMMRALRVGKMSLAALSMVTRAYLQDETLLQEIPLFQMLNYTQKELQNKAEALSELLAKEKVKYKIVDSISQVGGGTLPALKLPGKAIILLPPHKDKRFAQKVHAKLLQLSVPVLAVLREGQLFLDVRTIFPSDYQIIAQNIKFVLDNYEQE
jgi:L-seryl-tRNA(Ser) seleniumtransferase